MVAQKKTFKRKHDNLKSNVDIEKITESINDSKNDTSNNANDDTNEEDFDSEDLLAVELDSTHDSTDEEVDEENDIPQSDTEVDPTVFTSDDETNELEFETDSDKSIGETKSEEDTDQTKSEEDTDETKSEEDTDETKSEEDTDETNSEENTGKTSSEEETDETSSEEDIDEEDDNSYNKNNNKISKELSSKGKNSNAVINRKLDTTKHKANDKNGINKFSNEKHNNKAETVKHIESKNKLNNKLQHEQNEKSKLLSKKKLRPKNRNENKNTQNVTINQTFTSDEYEYDSSDEEDIRNTIGNIPMKWYNEYDHIGYDWDGKKIVKPEKGDELDNFLKRMEDPDFWKTVKDIQTGQDVVLSEADIELITRIQKQKIPDVQFDEYAPWVEWFTSQVLVTPLRKIPEHKRSFLPSKPEAKRVSKLVHALKMGWIKSTAEMQKEKQQKNKDPQFYMLWQSDDQAEEMRRIYKHIPAPKRHLPGHAESYNPPPEYLFDKKELKQWNKLETTPWKRKLHFIPQSYKSLREVPAYPRYIKERFQRCLDLYLCPRAFKMRLTIEPETLVPQLPDPKDLQPFPTTISLVFKGHTDMVRSITVELMGQYIASGGDDMMLKIWEVATGRCLKTINCGGVIRSVAWCPNQAISLIGVAAEKKVLLINPGVGDHLITTKTDELLKIIPQTDIIVSDRVKTAVQWDQATEESYTNGIRVILNHFKIVKQVTWHGKGDYFATVMPDGQNRSVLINQLSKRRSQLPFSRSKGLIQCVLFHPIRPFLFVATQRNIRIYDLVKQEMVKKLLSNSQWISTMAIHPGGDNILVGTYDRKMLWFDLDLSTKPYQTLRLHGTGVRGVAFHKRYPLFASGADDRGLIVSHGMVYNDLLQNPLIVPLKRFSNHESFNDFGILDVIFHPIQPWVFSAGADSTIRMYS